MNVDKYSDPGKDNDRNWDIQDKDVDKLRMVISTSIRTNTDKDKHKNKDLSGKDQDGATCLSFREASVRPPAGYTLHRSVHVYIIYVYV